MNSFRWVINKPSVASEILDGELVIMNTVGGKYHTSAGTGPLIWLCIERGMSRPAILKAIADACSVGEDMIASDLDTFVDELVSQGLICNAMGEQVTAEPEPPALPRTAYERPELSSYSDMQDLLLLDPIHDVSEEGWPARPQSH
jgi:hypothetical protein